MTDKNLVSDFCFIGGDKRQFYAAMTLAELSKKQIYVSGETFSSCSECKCCSEIIYKKSPLKAVYASKSIVLPLPASNVESEVSFIDIISAAKDSDRIILGGNFSAYMKELMCDEKVNYIDYYDDESFSIKNAYITAEGAISLAMNELDIMFRDTRCAIIGFGRIGKALSGMILSLGNRPDIYARHDEVKVLASEMGMGVMDSLDLSSYDIVFNTVPERIISDRLLLELKKSVIFIELASKPGGFDPDIALQCSHKVIDGRGMPGRYAPISAGEAVAKTIFDICKRDSLLF